MAHSHKKIAESYLLESEVDYQTAKITYSNGIYSRSVYFTQQAVEKAVKACLAMRGIFTSEHNLVAVFSALFKSQLEDGEKVVEAITFLERIGARARFPLFQRDDLPIWIPSKMLGKKESEDVLAKGEYAYERLRRYLTTLLREEEAKG